MTKQEEMTVFNNDENIGKEEPQKDSGKYLKLVLPLLLALMLTGAAFLPKAEAPKGDTTIKTLAVKNFPVTLVLEQRNYVIKSLWLRTKAGAREIDGLDGLSYVSEGTYVTKTAQGGKEDLLWRTSYTNFEGEGVHLWVGVSAAAGKIYIATSPYNYTKWDNIPAKLIVPKGTAVYISPAIPSYDSDSDSKEVFPTKDSYSFVYTVRMTPEGPAFVPVPSVYGQLAELLRAGIRGEYSTSKRLAYTRMIDEFDKLAEGNPPSAETLLNFQLNKVDTLSFRN